jgi:hypothetical protein
MSQNADSTLLISLPQLMAYLYLQFSSPVDQVEGRIH